MVSDRSNGIYRGFIAAIVGLILIGAAPNKDGVNQPDQSPAQKAETDQLKAIVAAIKESNKPPKPDNGCKAGKDDRGSDLCAQWKAADAAKDAAWWTFFAAITTVIGVIVGGFTLVAAGFAAWYAKNAANAASVGASAAIDAVAATSQANLLAMRANARATRQAVASARETAKALEIAERNANAAINAHETFISTERGRISFYRAEFHSRIDGIPGYSLVLYIHNLGNALAIIKSLHWHVGAPIFPKKTKYKEAKVIHIKSTDGDALVNNSQILQGLNIDPPNENIWPDESSIMGFVDYETIGKSCRSHFCFELKFVEKDGFVEGHWDCNAGTCANRPDDT